MIRQKITVEITKNEIIVSFRKSEKEKKVREAVVCMINRSVLGDYPQGTQRKNRKNHKGDIIKGEVDAGDFKKAEV